MQKDTASTALNNWPAIKQTLGDAAQMHRAKKILSGTKIATIKQSDTYHQVKVKAF